MQVEAVVRCERGCHGERLVDVAAVARDFLPPEMVAERQQDDAAGQGDECGTVAMAAIGSGGFRAGFEARFCERGGERSEARNQHETQNDEQSAERPAHPHQPRGRGGKRDGERAGTGVSCNLEADLPGALGHDPDGAVELMRAGGAGGERHALGHVARRFSLEHVGLGGDGLDVGAGTDDADGCLSRDDSGRCQRDVKGIRSGVGLDEDVGRSNVCAGGQREREKAAEQR